MILLHKVVQILTLSDGNGFFIGFVGIECGQSGRVGHTFIEGYHFGFIMVPDGLTEKSKGCRGISFGGQ
ncbi:conserved hypothetical protein [Xenorhabdus bovienii str. kraussei Becker Underwood]|uniref:Uncharacterized protein n=1 Tax=Xenorhabdus bovienii str. kraussei Becker Underwood TaxID=1398204 RepID=A0A077Q219_XENBV|nr:conserved hypothetical protein [Xenorhabdus bovienii str. kraussei Becker Underwood]